MRLCQLNLRLNALDLEEEVLVDTIVKTSQASGQQSGG